MLKWLIAIVILAGSAGSAWAEAAPYDQLFLRSEARGSTYELAIARLAETHAARADVKAYAATVVNDHEAYNSALRDLAQSKGVTLPPGMTAANRTKLDNLARLRGPAFDRAFIKEAQAINGQDRRDFRRQASRTTDPDIKAFVARFLEVDAKHEAGALALGRRTIASNMPVVRPPATGSNMPVINPPGGGRMPVITPPATAAQ